jgi:hypothetical protein
VINFGENYEAERLLAPHGFFEARDGLLYRMVALQSDQAIVSGKHGIREHERKERKREPNHETVRQLFLPVAGFLLNPVLLGTFIPSLPARVSDPAQT